MPFKRPPNKAELRKQLQDETNLYLQDGGMVHEIPRGLSGREDHKPLRPVLFDTPRESRTYVNDVVASIEERRKQKKPASQPKKSARKGYYKTVYDDFGEPIRKMWVEE